MCKTENAKFMARWGLISMWTVMAVVGYGQTTSPLAILNSAPKVKIDSTPAAPPRVQQPPAYYPPAGSQAPYVAPAYPALTPYSGQSSQGARTAPPSGQADYLDYGSAPVQSTPAPAGGMRSPRPYGSPTPRPVLGPEDVERQKPKKKGLVRGLLGVIPFVGDDEDEATPAPTPSNYPPGYATITPPDTPVYRGVETPDESEGENKLLAPIHAPTVQDNLPEDPEPSSPPILTPTPRGEMAPETVTEPANDAPVLTVKKESDDTSASEPVSLDAPTPSISTPVTATKPAITPRPTPEDIVITPDTKKPARSLDEEPAEGDTTSAPAKTPEVGDPTEIKVEDSRPQAPEPSGIILKAAEPPVVSSTPDAVSTESLVAVAEEVTSLTVEQSDLGMPNPTYEQNVVVLGEFQAAVRRARAEDYPAAAQLFREYVASHPSSGLAPRAAFLSVIFEKNIAKAKESLGILTSQYKESHYGKDAEKRRPELTQTAPAAAAAAATPTPAITETPHEKIARLEKELTEAIGEPAKETPLRRELGTLYVEQEEFDRAWEVLRPALDNVSGTAAEAPIMLLMARCQMSRRDTAKALGLVSAVEQNHPDAVLADAPSAWTAGLVYETAGRYTRARSLYGEIRTRWPQSNEAEWAGTRLQELSALAR